MTPDMHAGGQRRVYYGWVLIVTLALTETTSYGVLYYAFTVFLTPMHDAFGWSRGAMTGAFSLALVISGMAGVPAGRWLDRHGPRALMTAGSCVASLLVLAWAAVPNLAVFYLVWAAIGVTMAAVLYEPAFVVVATWFRRKRGRALTVLTFIAGFASVIYLPLAGWLVEHQGWRTALVILAVVLAAGTIAPHALILRHRPEGMGLLPDGELPETASVEADAQPKRRASSPQRSIPTSTAVRGSPFRWLTLAFCLNAVGQVAMQVHLVPYLTEMRGYGAGAAATLAGLIGILALPGRLIFTPLGDRLPRSIITATIFLLQSAALLALLLVGGDGGVIGYVVLFGIGFGAVTPARAALTADFYGSANYGSIAGVMALFVTAARASGPVGAGTAYDLVGGYTPVLWVLVGVSTLSALAVLIAELQARPLLAYISGRAESAPGVTP